MRRLIQLMRIVGVVSVLAGGRAWAQQLELQVDSETIYANLPFTLSVVARGFAEEPQPKISKLVVAGCRVVELGVQPNVSSMVQIVNGQRSEQREVAFVYRYRIEAQRPGEYAVPALVAEQGGKRAQSRTARFVAKALEETRDMQVRLVLPQRPVWVGETIDAGLEWYLRRDVNQRTFTVPLFDMEDWVEVEPGIVGKAEGKLGGFHAGAKELELPFERDKAQLDGVEYTRIRFRVRLTPIKAGVLSAPAARVMAALESGVGRDMFGFPVPQMRLYQASSKPVQLEVRALPLADRPASFRNAVGAGFSLEVSAQRTVARVGDPIELKLLVRGAGRLTGLILPELESMGLSAEHFAVPAGSVAGELLDDGKGKLFRVTVRLRSTAAVQVPALSLSYFDPEKGAYQTVKSQPIALSVEGSAVVGAGDVVAGGAAGGGAAAGGGSGPAGGAAGGAGGSAGSVGSVGQGGHRGGSGVPAKGAVERGDEAALAGQALVGADLSLSEEGQTLRQGRGGLMWPVLGGLYGIPLLVLGVQAMRRRGRAGREQAHGLRQAVGEVEGVLIEAERSPAREVVPRLVQGLRRLRERSGAEPAGWGRVMERLETEGYSPQAATQPLDRGLREEVRGVLAELGAGTSAGGGAAGGGAAGGGAAGGGGPAGRGVGRGVMGMLLWVGLGMVLGWGRPVWAAVEAGGDKLTRARAAYRAALAEADGDRRRGGFVQAEGLYRELSTEYADRPQLLVDWGNAALMAQEPGRAVLAYRRALLLDRDEVRARRNLSFVRERLPEWLPRPKAGGAVDTLFFWHQGMSVQARQVAGAVAFALAVLLLVPGRRGLRRVALLPLLVWGAMLVSVVIERDAAQDGVIVAGGGVLRTADSMGAPPALGRPMPAGAEVLVKEARGDWVRVELADGQGGWLQASSVERVK